MTKQINLIDIMINLKEEFEISIYYEEVRDIDISEKLKEDIEKYYKENSYRDLKRGNCKVKYLKNGDYRFYKKKGIM